MKNRNPVSSIDSVKRGCEGKEIMEIKNEFSFLDKFREKHPISIQRKAVILLVLQTVMIFLLIATMILVYCVDAGDRRAFYMALLMGLAFLLGLSTFYNSRGKYLIAAWITTICMLAGPWISILFDPSILNGDVVPFVYVGLSIQLCAILLSERATLLLSTVQLLGVLAALLFSPKLADTNWPSLFAFIVFTAAIGVSTGYTNRKQLEQIVQQHRQLLDDEAQLRELSLKDSLTGLYNRRYMEESFDREIERMRRAGHQLAVVMTDIDRFKAINDTYGHVVGDAVLAFTADFFLKNTRNFDIVCRYGGDEFIIIFPDCSREEAAERAEILRSSISASEVVLLGQTVSPLTLSFGIAVLPADGLTRQALIAAADAALYAAKEAGRNRVE